MKTKISYYEIKEITYEFNRAEIEQKLSEEIDMLNLVGGKKNIDFSIDEDSNVEKSIITCIFPRKEIDIPKDED